MSPHSPHPPSPPHPGERWDLAPGTIICGKFKVVRQLGSGTMGTVYECSSESARPEIVAIKILRGTIDQSRAAARFRNELHASYRVSHSNVVRAKEFFRTEKYLAFSMELIRGLSLSERLASERQISPDESISLLLQLCDGLSAIHQAGIIHRDVKPQNIMITPEGKVKITDFSAAKFRNPPPGYDDREIIGTLCYMSPEALKGHSIDERSDVYSLGILGYELITGHVPYQTTDFANETELRFSARAPAPADLVRSCPRYLSNVIMTAINRDPAKRFRSTQSMKHALQNPGKSPKRRRRSPLAALARRLAPLMPRRPLTALVFTAVVLALPVLAVSTPIGRFTGVTRYFSGGEPSAVTVVDFKKSRTIKPRAAAAVPPTSETEKPLPLP